MRLILTILIFFSGTVFSRYYEKRRFDRSVYDYAEASHINVQIKKEWTFTDYETNFRAYRDREENNCYIEKLEDNVVKEELKKNETQQKKTPKILYAPNESLTKFEAWQIAGGRVVNFCIGRKIILLQYTMPTPEETIDPFSNILPYDENDIVARRVADVVLTPLISRAKRQAILEEKQKLNENFKQNRLRRQVQQSSGRFRGQTQSQYLSIGNTDQKDGKAEAEATRESSRAVVSGSYGMGQAQSMSLGNIGCEECPKYTGEGAPDRFVQHPRMESTGTDYGRFSIPRTGTGETNAYPRTFPSFKPAGDSTVHTGMITPGTGTVYANKFAPGAIRTTDDVLPQSRVPGSTTGGHIVYPSNVPATTRGGTEINYPGNLPGSVPGVTSDSGVTYPGNVDGTRGGMVYPGGVIGPTTGGNIPYTGGVPGSATGGNIPFPGGVAGPTIGGIIPYPVGVPGSATGGNIPYPGGVSGSLDGGNIPYLGGVPGSPTGGNIPYPAGVPGSPTGGNIPYPAGVPGSATGGNIPYSGSVPGSVPGGNILYPGSVPGSVPGGNIPYPGGVPGSTTGGNILFPGGTPGSVTGGNIPYPGGVMGPMTGGVVYPGGLSGPTTRGYVPYPQNAPGAKAESSATYIGGAPSTTAGSGAAYHRGVPGSKTGGDIILPGSVPGTTVRTGVSYPGYVPADSGPSYYREAPGSVTGGNVPYPGIPPGTPSSGSTIYPGSVPGIRTTGGPMQLDNTQGPLANERLGTYPSGIRPGATDITPGQIVTESKATADTKTYPNGQSPTKQYFPEGHYPTSRESNIRDNIYQNVGPMGIPPGGITAAGTRGVFPGGTSPPGGKSTETLHYPGGVAPDTVVHRDTVSGTPGSVLTSDHISYPGSPNIVHTGPTPSAGTIGTYPESTRAHIGSDNIHLQKFGTDQSGIPYPPGHVQYPEGGIVQSPETGKYSNNRGIMYPGYSQQGQYPSTATWHDRGISTPGLLREPPSRGVNRPETGQYPSEGIRQQYAGYQYPGSVAPTTNAGDVSSYYQQPGSSIPPEDDNSNSQASSSVKQTDSGTQASASAQGKHGQGTAQSQVTGTYSGSGSFSAQAGSTDANKSVQTEISGGKDGAASNAQGVGGYGKSQAQVQLNSESGATTTGAQSSGWNHGTNSQVQASSRGGMADAQANGEGSTSSQAQIGFQPYLKTDEKLEKRTRPFRGGGTASAQSGAHTGQSQSQLEGSFQYGITYTGAAQAGSGSGAAASRKPFNFSLTDTELFKPFKPSYTPQIVPKNGSDATSSSSDTNYQDNPEKLKQGLQTSSSSLRRVISKPVDQATQNTPTKINQSVDRSQVGDTVYDYEEDYDGEDYDTSPIQSSSNSKISKTYTTEQNNTDRQAQTIHVTTGNQYDVHSKQDANAAQVSGTLQPGEALSGYTLPAGFRGRVTSAAGDETVAVGDGNSQSQTVTLASKEPNMTHENKSPISETRSLKTNHERLIEDHVQAKAKQKKNFPQGQSQQISTEYSRPISNVPMKPSYYTITNSVAGKLDDRNSARKYEHRYYTKSSTCGYFTFSCNVVYGSNGRTKICKPKMPTYPDGTPMKC